MESVGTTTKFGGSNRQHQHGDEIDSFHKSQTTNVDRILVFDDTNNQDAPLHGKATIDPEADSQDAVIAADNYRTL